MGMKTIKVKMTNTVVVFANTTIDDKPVKVKRTAQKGKVYELKEHAAKHQIRLGNAVRVEKGKPVKIKEEIE